MNDKDDECRAFIEGGRAYEMTEDGVRDDGPVGLLLGRRPGDRCWERCTCPDGVHVEEGNDDDG